MSKNEINQKTLSNLKSFDETRLLDNIEDLDYVKTLLFDGMDNGQNLIAQRQLKLFKQIRAIKQKNIKLKHTDIWSEAIELEQTLWHASMAINDTLLDLYALLSSNTELGYELEIDLYDDDSDESDDD